MGTRFFIFPADSDLAVLAEISDAAFENLKAWHQAFRQTEANHPLTCMVYEWLPGARFEVIELRGELMADAETAEMFACVISEGATYQLNTPIDSSFYETVEAGLEYVEASHGGITLMFEADFDSVLVELVTWNELGIDNEDLRRCRYNDCIEAHPVAGEDELVTCHTCRRNMCLPVGEEEN
jgi:hypothetical protein